MKPYPITRAMDPSEPSGLVCLADTAGPQRSRRGRDESRGPARAPVRVCLPDGFTIIEPL